MTFVIRADATISSGAGHVMRTSVLAQELMKLGYPVTFIGDVEQIPWVREYIRNLGFTKILRSVSEYIQQNLSDTLILDSYTINENDVFIQPNRWKNILSFIDDATPSYKANMYVHAGPQTNWKPPVGFQKSDFFSGIEYIQLRESLVVNKRTPRTRNGLPMILISGGGSDPNNFCKAVYEILNKSQLEFNALIFANPFNIRSDDRRFTFGEMGIALEENIQNSDLVFSTAGTSSWEYIFLGKKLGIGLGYENQRANYEFQIQNRLAFDIGNFTSAHRWNLIDSKIHHQIENWAAHESIHPLVDIKELASGNQTLVKLLISRH